MGNTSLYEHYITSLVFNEPTDHTFVRRHLALAFTPRALKKVEPHVYRLITPTLDRVAKLREFKFMHDFVMTLPTELIGDMLGMPPINRYRLTPSAVAIMSDLGANFRSRNLLRSSGTVEKSNACLRWLITNRGRNPCPKIAKKCYSASSSERHPLGTWPLHNCIFLLIAGHETIIDMITNGIDAPIRFPN